MSSETQAAGQPAADEASSGGADASGGAPDSEAELAAARAALAEAEAALDAAAAAARAGREAAGEAARAANAGADQSVAGAPDAAPPAATQAGTPAQAQAAAAQASAAALEAAAAAYAKAAAQLDAAGRTVAATAPGRSDRAASGDSQSAAPGQPGEAGEPGAEQPGDALMVASADLDAASVLLASASGNLSGRGGAQIIVLDQNLTEEMLLEGTAGGVPGATGTLIIVPGEPGAIQTGDERRAGLDRELKVSLATFDGKLIAEQERIRANDRGDAGQAGDPGEAEEEGDSAFMAGDPAFGGPPPIQTGRAGKPGARTSSGAGAVPGGAPSRTGTGSGTGPTHIPADIPDGDDDDVVARQLREAAMNESDPELREKLWDEYRTYKQGTGR